MPHLVLHGQELDDAYPSLTVPEEEFLQDAARDEDDATLQAGLREATVVAREARDQGRKRRMSPTASTTTTTTSTTTTTTTKEPKCSNTAKEKKAETVKLVAEQEEATVRSALGRRRSSKESLVLQAWKSPEKPPKIASACEDCLRPSRLLVYQFTSACDLCTCVLHRSAQAVIPGTDHPEYTTPQF